AASPPPADRPGGSTSGRRRARRRAPAGWSHSCVTATTSSSSPSANNSYVEGCTVFTMRVALTIDVRRFLVVGFDGARQGYGAVADRREDRKGGTNVETTT